MVGEGKRMGENEYDFSIRHPQCINGEDQKAEHSGQGVLNLYTNNSYDYDFTFLLLDWQAINDVIVEHDIPLEPCKSGDFAWRNLYFVGGVSDSQYGLAMMDTASYNPTAKRSWHFYGDANIAVATNLTLPTSTTTTICFIRSRTWNENRKLS
jgi:hypothetical protein